MHILALSASLRIVLHIDVHYPMACHGPYQHYLYLLSHLTPLTHTTLPGVSFNSPGLTHKTFYQSFPFKSYSSSLHIHSGLAIVILEPTVRGFQVLFFEQCLPGVPQTPFLNH